MRIDRNFAIVPAHSLGHRRSQRLAESTVYSIAESEQRPNVSGVPGPDPTLAQEHSWSRVRKRQHCRCFRILVPVSFYSELGEYCVVNKSDGSFQS